MTLSHIVASGQLAWCLPLRRDCLVRAADHGAVLEVTRRWKETTYPELSGEGGRLVVVATDVGRWNSETVLHIRARFESSSVWTVVQWEAQGTLSLLSTRS